MLKKILLGLGLALFVAGAVVQLAYANHTATEQRSAITPPPAKTPPTDLIPVDDDDLPRSGTSGFTVRSNTTPVETVPPMATVPPKPTVPPPVDAD
jgi:hypothetical protein